MTNRVQTFRIATTNQIPAPGQYDPGQLWVNYADLQLGVIDNVKSPQKLLAVRFFRTTATYVLNDVVVHNGGVWTCKGVVAPGPFDPSMWTQLGVGASGGGAYLPLAGGTMVGPLYLYENPLSPSEAATKQYVDNAVATGGGGGGPGGPYLPLAGGTMLGDVTLFRDPTTPFMAATKGYVDAHSGGGGGGAGYLPLAGGTMTGPIVLAADPAAPLQAATKQYVDTHSVAAAGNCPTGAVMDFAAPTPRQRAGSCATARPICSPHRPDLRRALRGDRQSLRHRSGRLLQECPRRRSRARRSRRRHAAAQRHGRSLRLRRSRRQADRCSQRRQIWRRTRTPLSATFTPSTKIRITTISPEPQTQMASSRECPRPRPSS